jgi:RNase P subunit RPR2
MSTDEDAGPVALVRVRCDACGPVMVPPADLRLLGSGDRATYACTCPDCGVRIRRPADAALAEVLRGAGVSALRAV